MRFQHECKVGQGRSSNNTRRTGFCGRGLACGRSTTIDPNNGHAPGRSFSGVETEFASAEFDGDGRAEYTADSNLKGVGRSFGAFDGTREDWDRQ